MPAAEAGTEILYTVLESLKDQIFIKKVNVETRKV